MTKISMGICAYNEEKNIGKLLTVLLSQRTGQVDIDEIIVVSSGSTDRTDTIVEELSKKNKIVLVKQRERAGKASAVNEFLKLAGNNILVLESADTIPERGSIERLCLPFRDNKIGMVGARPIPTNHEHTFMGYVDHLLWKLHHSLAQKNPKCGELIAFRKLFYKIATDTAVDEAWIEYEVTRRGYKVVYAADAIVYNKGPETIRDFLKQRRRITYGHIDLFKRTKYKVSSHSTSLLLSTIFQVFPYGEPKKWLLFFTAFALETVGRFLGHYDYYRKKGHVVWEISQTTKGAINVIQTKAGY